MSAWLLEVLIATSLLIALVLLLRAPIRRAFGAGATYALWLIPALRLVLPSIAVLAPIVPTTTATMDLVWAVAPGAPTATPWLLWFWAAGAAAFAAWQIVGYRRFLLRALGDAVPGETFVATEAVAGPCAAGLFTRYILVPIDFAERFSPVERDLALRHERAHHARGDIWANVAALAMLSLHWFNPLAWAAYRAFREDQELSCDAAVIGAAAPETRAAYAAAMVKSAWGASPPFTCPMSRTGSIKRRLKMVGTHRKSTLASLGGLVTAGVIAVGGLTLTATGAAAADPVKMQRIVIKRGDGADATAELGKVLDGKCGAGLQSALEAARSGGAGKPPRVIRCDMNRVSTASDAATLQKARDQIAASSNLETSERIKVLGALDEALAKARSR